MSVLLLLSRKHLSLGIRASFEQDNGWLCTTRNDKSRRTILFHFSDCGICQVFLHCRKRNSIDIWIDFFDSFEVLFFNKNGSRYVNLIFGRSSLAYAIKKRIPRFGDSVAAIPTKSLMGGSARTTLIFGSLLYYFGFLTR